MTWGDSPTSAGLAGVASTSPARGRPVADILLCLLRLCLISGNFLHAAQRACDLLQVVLLGLERFSYGRGRSRPLSFPVLLHSCLHIMLAMYSEFICIHMIACHHVHQLHSLSLSCS
jgi:hypothetical protein